MQSPQQPESVEFGKVSGIEFQTAVLLGQAEENTFHTLLGFRVLEVDEAGYSKCEAVPQPQFGNGAGPLHGGYLSALMDCGTAVAVHSCIPSGVGAPHIHANYRFIAATSTSTENRLTIESKVTSQGRSIIHCTVTVIDSRGAIVCAGETIHKVRSLRRPPASYAAHNAKA